MTGTTSYPSRRTLRLRNYDYSQAGAYFVTICTEGRICHQRADMGLWQRNFYERVIRNERELSAIREYIIANPLQWHLDRENPDR
jgi:hypothetical protein